MRRLLALTALLLAPGLHAETYKWVDERGVVNYSNTPPPAAKAPIAVAERVSTYETDPGLRRAAAYTAPTPYEAMQQQEWLQRQRLMAEAQNLDKALAAAPPVVDDPVYSYPLYASPLRASYASPYGYGRAVRKPARRGGLYVRHHRRF